MTEKGDNDKETMCHQGIERVHFINKLYNYVLTLFLRRKGEDKILAP